MIRKKIRYSEVMKLAEKLRSLPSEERWRIPANLRKWNADELALLFYVIETGDTDVLFINCDGDDDLGTEIRFA